MRAGPLTTFSLWHFPTLEARVWAFVQMGLARAALGRQAGLVFWKLVGAGSGGGFSLEPDWSRYGLFAVWQSAAHAERFFAEPAPVVARYREHSDEEWTIRLEATQSKGKWSGENPFLTVADARHAALANAARLLAAVPATSAALARAPGLLISVGVGEIPYLRQATFSLWRDEAALRDFAYRDPVHREVIARTRDERWYSEELFARFRPVAASGAWAGREPLREAAHDAR